MVKLKDVTSEAIYLGKMSHSEAATLAKKLLKQGGIKISEQMEKVLDRVQTAAHKRHAGLAIDRYLRYLFNKPSQHWVVSDNIGEDDTIICYSVEPETKNIRGYIPDAYYVYRVSGSAPKIGYETYDDAKEEINRIRKEDSSAKLADFIIFKCAGINYAEVEYKEIKGE